MTFHVVPLPTLLASAMFVELDATVRAEEQSEQKKYLESKLNKQDMPKTQNLVKNLNCQILHFENNFLAIEK